MSRWVKAILLSFGFTAALLALSGFTASAEETDTDRSAPLSGLVDDLAGDLTAPITESLAPATDPIIEPLEEATAPVTEPVAEVVQEIAEPITDPVVDAVAEPIRPVVEDVVTPVTDAAASTVAPVSERVAPVVQTAADAVTPVSDAAAPIAEDVAAAAGALLTPSGPASIPPPGPGAEAERADQPGVAAPSDPSATPSVPASGAAESPAPSTTPVGSVTSPFTADAEPDRPAPTLPATPLSGLGFTAPAGVGVTSGGAGHGGAGELPQPVATPRSRFSIQDPQAWGVAPSSDVDHASLHYTRPDASPD